MMDSPKVGKRIALASVVGGDVRYRYELKGTVVDGSSARGYTVRPDGSSDTAAWADANHVGTRMYDGVLCVHCGHGRGRFIR